MDWQYLLFLSLVPVTVTALIVSITLAWRWRRTQHGKALLALQGVVLCWLLFDTLELISTTESLSLFFIKVVYIFIIVTPVVWLYFALVYSRTLKSIGQDIIWFCVIPALSIIGAWTNSYHHLMWREHIFEPAYGMLAVSNVYGPYFYVHTVYSYLLFLAGVVVVVHSLYHGPLIFRKQLNSFILGISLILGYNILYVLDLFPIQKDFSPILLGIPGILLVFSMLKYRLLELQPMSRDILLDYLLDGIIILNQDHRILDINMSALRILGVEGRKPPIGDLLESHFAAWTTFSRKLGESDGKIISLKWMATDDTDHIVYQVQIKPMHNGVMLTFHEVTETEKLLEHIQELAAKDPLTSVFNRREFFQQGEAAVSLARRHQRPLSIMILDIDYFKQFNDRFGHQIGDNVLEIFAAYCQENFRKSDILARYGGDEFIALLPETNVEQAARLAGRINQEIKTIWLDSCGPDCELALSIGLAEASETDQELTLEGLIDRADQALYKAKGFGRDCYAIWQSQGDFV